MLVRFVHFSLTVAIKCIFTVNIVTIIALALTKSNVKKGYDYCPFFIFLYFFAPKHL